MLTLNILLKKSIKKYLIIYIFVIIFILMTKKHHKPQNNKIVIYNCMNTNQFQAFYQIICGHRWCFFFFIIIIITLFDK